MMILNAVIASTFPQIAFIDSLARKVQFDPVSTKNQTLTIGAVGLPKR